MKSVFVNQGKKEGSAGKIQARTEEAANFENGAKLMQLASGMLFGKPADKEGAVVLAGMAKERFLKVSKSASARGASFDAAVAIYDAAGATAILSDNFEEELELLDAAVKKLKEAVPKVESGEIEVGVFESVVKNVNTHLYIHFIMPDEEQAQRIVGLMLECNEMLSPLAEQTDDYLEQVALIGTRGLLRVYASGGGNEDKLAGIHADVVNGFKDLAKKLEQNGGAEEAKLASALRNEILQDFNQTFRLLRSSPTGRADLKDVKKWLGQSDDPNDPRKGLPIHG